MEIVQTVLVKIAATRLDEASGPNGLLSELEAHRGIASAQRGFRGMRVTRTANPEGDVLVVTETRWANPNALADYTTRKDNVASIIEKHAGETVPNSLQVHRMEGVDNEAAEAPNKVYDRLALPLLIPIGVLAFALLVIYSLSRIYLALPSNAATPLAAGIAIGVLLIAYYFSSNPNLPRWQIGAVALIVLAALGVGGTAAAIYDNKNAVYKTPEPAPVASPAPGTTPPAPGQLTLIMQDNVFKDEQGNSNPNITVPNAAGKPITIQLRNEGTAVHNTHVASGGTYAVSGTCKANQADPCSTPPAVRGGQTATITLTLPAGTYDYRCDFHPDQMKGKITIQ